jgi:hypothetical protein
MGGNGEYSDHFKTIGRTKLVSKKRPMGIENEMKRDERHSLLS